MKTVCISWLKKPTTLRKLLFPEQAVQFLPTAEKTHWEFFILEKLPLNNCQFGHSRHSMSQGVFDRFGGEPWLIFK